jgi:hypothetical protein
MLGDEAQQERPGVGHAHQHGTACAGRFEHRAQVLHPVLRQRATVRRALVGESGAARVEPDHAAERREPVQVAQRRRVFEDHVHRAPQPDRVDEVEGSVAENLIGDTVAADRRETGVRLR